MNGTWMTCWDIAGKRHSTKMGENHLSDHALEVLQAFVVQEAQEAMRLAIGHIRGFHRGDFFENGETI